MNDNKESQDIELISRYLRDELSIEEKEQFESRMTKEPSFAKEVESYREMTELLISVEEQELLNSLDLTEDEEPLSDKQKEQRRVLYQQIGELDKSTESTAVKKSAGSPKVRRMSFTPLYRVAAIFIIVVGVGSVLYYQSTKSIPTGSGIADTDSLKNDMDSVSHIAEELPDAPIKEQAPETPEAGEEGKEVTDDNPRLIAMAGDYSSIPHWDDYMSLQQVRSDFSLLSPEANDTIYKNTLHFEWEEALEEDLYLEVFTAKTEDDPIQIAIDPGERTYTLSKELSPDLYYWKLQTEEELLHVGKFRVNP